jgi:hypothetical protein
MLCDDRRHARRDAEPEHEVRGLKFWKGECSFDVDLAGKLINIVGPAC